MIAYIKSKTDFSLKAVAACESWDLPFEAVPSESGKAVLSGIRGEVSAGDWLYLQGRLVRIEQAAPDENETTLTTSDPVNAFGRKLFWPENPAGSYGGFLRDALEREYRDCSDVFYRLPYLEINESDETPLETPELDDTRLYTLDNIMAAARRRGVLIRFGLASRSSAADTLTIDISTAPDITHKIVLGDGHHQLVSADYSPNTLSRITVMHEQERAEDAEADAPTEYKLYDFYLAAEGYVSETPPEHRAEGEWDTITCQVDDVPLRVASSLFQDNLKSHRIEFDSDRAYSLYDHVLLRLPDRILKTQIISVGSSSSDSRTRYKCGELAVTLTDKVKAANGGKP